MGKIVVASGWRYTDIDALACAIAYKELLEKERKNTIVLLPGVFNKSITNEVKKWDLDYETDYEPAETDKFVVVDLSEPDYISPLVNQDRIIELYDHHFGHEDYWKKRLGKNAKIEKVGACTTLIWEEFEKRLSPLKISTLSANLIYTAIISNTLNFKASVTTQRDKKAFEKIKQFTKLPENWIEKYFEDQEIEIFKNPQEAIINDTKKVGQELVIGQLELWDSRRFLTTHLKDVEKALNSFGNEKWFLTTPSISEGINYIYTKHDEVKKLLGKIIGAKFKGDIGTTERLWLRKEILKKLLIGKL